MIDWAQADVRSNDTKRYLKEKEDQICEEDDPAAHAMDFRIQAMFNSKPSCGVEESSDGELRNKKALVLFAKHETWQSGGQKPIKMSVMEENPLLMHLTKAIRKATTELCGEFTQIHVLLDTTDDKNNYWKDFKYKFRFRVSGSYAKLDQKSIENTIQKVLRNDIVTDEVIKAFMKERNDQAYNSYTHALAQGKDTTAENIEFDYENDIACKWGDIYFDRTFESLNRTNFETNHFSLGGHFELEFGPNVSDGWRTCYTWAPCIQSNIIRFERSGKASILSKLSCC